MSLVVQKFGGTSVADADRIRAVADHVARTRRAGDQVVVVVSAMGKTTDQLVRLAADVSTTQPTREVDMLLSAGERITMALLCMALADLGVDAQSFTGSQAGIITDDVHTRAKILEIRGDRLRASLAAGVVPVVAGFQGVSTDRDVTTLGRGGSDTTAVALAGGGGGGGGGGEKPRGAGGGGGFLKKKKTPRRKGIRGGGGPGYHRGGPGGGAGRRSL
jgi:aspartate kinase